jgi:multidrug efflux pump subunit AcrB
MNISEFSVKRFQFTIVVFLMLSALGISSLLSIPKAEDPSFPATRFAMISVLPGATPVDMERLVVDPIERHLKGLDDVKSLKTKIEDSIAVTEIEFLATVDADRKNDEVMREAGVLRAELPKELARLEVKQFKPSKVNIREFALVSDTMPYGALDALTRGVKTRFEAVPGIRTVEVSGLPKRELRIELDLERMAALGIQPGEVIAAVGSDAVNIPAGTLEAGTRRLSVRSSGDYGSVEEVRNTVIRSAEGRNVHVGDIATTQLTEVEASQFARFDGERAVLIAVNQKEEQNIFDTAARVESELDKLQQELPPSVVLRRGFDQSKNVSHRLRGFSRDFALAIFLVLLTLLPLGLRASAVVMVSIPLSLAIGVFILKVAGFSINQLSIVGFVIALGLLVDDSVVVVENIARFIRLGHAPKDAAIKATKQITVSVLGCTATLVFAFLPLLFLPGLAGKFIRSLPMAAVSTIAASLFVSLTIVPFLSSLLLKSEGEHGNIFFRGMTWLIEGSYRRILHRAIARPYLTLGVAALLFMGSIALVPKIGFSLFPKAGTPQFMVNIETEEGSSLAETDRAVRTVEATLKRHPEIVHVAANVGRGNPFIYYNIAPHNEKANVAEVFAETEHLEGPALASFLSSVRKELTGVPGAHIELKEFENGPPLDAPIAFRLLGDDAASVRAAALQVEGVVAKIAGTRDVRNPSRDQKTDLRVKIDREKAALVGVSAPDLDRMVRLSLGGVSAGAYRADEGDEEREIRITTKRPVLAPENPVRGRPTLDSLNLTYVPTSRRTLVPLSQVATLELESAPTSIVHYNTERSATVTSYAQDGFNVDRITNAAIMAIAKETLPPGVRMVVAGEVESRQESFGGLGMAIIIAGFGVLAVLILEFRTFKSTLIVASVIPLGVVGGMIALFLSGNTLSFTAVIGFIALMGIEVKNSILLVDFTNHLREEGATLDDAIQTAGEVRFVPILLTTLTAIGGLLPLALEHSPLYSPLALVLLGGLISSTLLTRIVTPVLYKLLAPEIERERPVLELSHA